MHPEELRIYQGHEKPLVMTNQVAVALSRPAAAPRPLPAVVLTPQSIPGEFKKMFIKYNTYMIYFPKLHMFSFIDGMISVAVGIILNNKHLNMASSPLRVRLIVAKGSLDE